MTDNSQKLHDAICRGLGKPTQTEMTGALVMEEFTKQAEKAKAGDKDALQLMRDIAEQNDAAMEWGTRTLKAAQDATRNFVDPEVFAFITEIHNMQHGLPERPWSDRWRKAKVSVN